MNGVSSKPGAVQRVSACSCAPRQSSARLKDTRDCTRGAVPLPAESAGPLDGEWTALLCISSLAAREARLRSRTGCWPMVR